MPTTRPQVITVSRLAWMDRCPRRLWMDRFGDPSERVAESMMGAILSTQGQIHEQGTVEANLGPVTSITVANWPEQLVLSKQLMIAGEQHIQHAALESLVSPDLRLCGVPDVLVRCDIPSRLGSWSYFPIELKHHREATPADLLQLDAYRWLLSEVQGIVPPGELWLGSDIDGIPYKFHHSDSLDTFDSTVSNLESLFFGEQAPPIWFVKECNYCPWRQACERVAIERGELAVLPGLRRTTWEEMRADEVSTVQHIASMRETDLIQYRGIGERSARALHTAAQALTIGAPVWIQGEAKTQNHEERAVSLFLDLETDPFTQEPWAFAWATPGDKVTIAIVTPRRTRREICIQDVNIIFLSRVDAGWSLIATAAAQRPGSICHWGTHERTCLERHPKIQIRAKILPRLMDVHRELKQRVVFPIPRTPTQTNGSLKAIGTWLGVAWPEGLDGGLVVANAFDTWRKSGDANLLNQIISYQRADLDALSRAWHWLQSDAT